MQKNDSSQLSKLFDGNHASMFCCDCLICLFSACQIEDKPDGLRFVDLVSRKALAAGTAPLPAASVWPLTTAGRKTIKSTSRLRRPAIKPNHKRE